MSKRRFIHESATIEEHYERLIKHCRLRLSGEIDDTDVQRENSAQIPQLSKRPRDELDEGNVKRTVHTDPVERDELQYVASVLVSHLKLAGDSVRSFDHLFALAQQCSFVQDECSTDVLAQYLFDVGLLIDVEDDSAVLRVVVDDAVFDRHRQNLFLAPYDSIERNCNDRWSNCFLNIASHAINSIVALAGARAYPILTRYELQQWLPTLCFVERRIDPVKLVRLLVTEAVVQLPQNISFENAIQLLDDNATIIPIEFKL